MEKKKITRNFIMHFKSIDKNWFKKLKLKKTLKGSGIQDIVASIKLGNCLKDRDAAFRPASKDCLLVKRNLSSILVPIKELQ